MKPATIFFDLDDTLLREKESAALAFAAAAAEARAKYGLKEDAVVKAARESARRVWYALPTIGYCLKIGISSWEGLWAEFGGAGPDLAQLRKLKARYRADAWRGALLTLGVDDPAGAEELSETFIRERRKMHVVLPGAERLLEKLSGEYRLGMITNGAPDLQRAKIEGGGLERFFAAILVSGEVGEAKPHPLIFRRALEMAGADADASLMIGDTFSTDIEGAQNAGMRAIWVNRRSEAAPEGRSGFFEVAGLEDIIPLIDSLL